MTNSTHSRRALVAAMIGGAAGLSISSVEVAEAEDRELVGLGAQWAQLLAARDAHERDVLEPAYDRQAAVQKPDALRKRRGDWMCGVATFRAGYFDADEIEQFKTARAGHLALQTEHGANGDFLARCDEVLAAWGDYQAQLAAARQASGAADAEAKADAIDRRLASLEDRILATRATTLDGMRVKARIAARFTSPEDSEKNPDQVALRSLIADLAA